MTVTAMIVLLTLGAVEPLSDSICALSRIDRARTLSSTCLACHDGSAAPAIGLQAAPAHAAHPVSVSYARAPADVAVRAQGPRDARVVLPAGRVECVTCHAEQGPGPHKTVVALRDLCVGCHQK